MFVSDGLLSLWGGKERLSNMDKRFLLVSTDVCPEVFLKTVEAKKKIALYSNRSTMDILHEIGIGKSAFYKYRCRRL